MDRILEWYGADNYHARLETVRRFWTGEGRHLVSLSTTQHNYRQTFDDETMLREAPHQLQYMAGLPGLNLPAFLADFGTISTARYWGGTPRFDSTGDNIFLDPVTDRLDDALARTPLPVDQPDLDAARGLRLFHRLCESLQTDCLWLRTPDMQGPLNTAGMILNQEELFVNLHLQPADVHRFLDNVTSFLIDYATFLRNGAQGRICGNIWPYTFLPADLGVSLTEDMMPLLSAELYAEFALPTLKRLAGELGSLLIHCCGEWGRHARTLAESGVPVCGAEYHYPWTTVKELLPLTETGTVLIPMIKPDKQDRFTGIVDYYRYLLKEFGNDVRFWFCLFEDVPGALAFAREWDASQPS